MSSVTKISTMLQSLGFSEDAATYLMGQGIEGDTLGAVPSEGAILELSPGSTLGPTYGTTLGPKSAVKPMLGPIAASGPGGTTLGPSAGSTGPNNGATLGLGVTEGRL
jgi:hypothetical protein